MATSASGPDTSTGVTNYGTPVGSFLTYKSSRRSSVSLPPSYPGSSSLQEHHPLCLHLLHCHTTQS